MNRLSVNIDHVATIRQARKADEPDPVWAAVEAELGGADGITFHLREDRRHINDRDAEMLRRAVASPLNMEMSIAPDIVEIALRLKPAKVTLVPERREELTTEGGLDVVKLRKKLRPLVRKFIDAGIEASAFIVPDPAQIDAAAETEFETVELWTGGFAHASDRSRLEELARLHDGIHTAIGNGLGLRAGHGLTYRNISELASCSAFSEYNIGHSIVSRAVLVGMRTAVQEMKKLLQDAKLNIALLELGSRGLIDDDDSDDLDDDNFDDDDEIDMDSEEPESPKPKVPSPDNPRKNGHK